MPAEAMDTRIRLTSIAGTLAAVVVTLSFFLPWVSVPAEEAANFQRELEERLADPHAPLPPGVHAEDWRRLGSLVAEQGAVSGLDIFYWARTARATADAFHRGDEAAPQAEGDQARIGSSRTSVPTRAILLVAIALAALVLTAGFVAIAFLLGRLQRVPSLVLVLALLTGALAVVIPAAYSIVSPALGFETHAQRGLLLLLPAGGVLFLAGVFGVRLSNWWRVLVGTLLLGGLLALAAWGYVASGT